jgi:hypothetical protein
VRYEYPLFEDGYDRRDCEELLKQHGLHPNFPIYMSRGGCKFCFFKSVSEYKAMYILDNATFEEGLKLEQDIQDEREKYFSILPNKNFKYIKTEAENEIKNWGVEAVIDFYKKTADTKVCGLFCHR